MQDIEAPCPVSYETAAVVVHCFNNKTGIVEVSQPFPPSRTLGTARRYGEQFCAAVQRKARLLLPFYCQQDSYLTKSVVIGPSGQTVTRSHILWWY